MQLNNPEAIEKCKENIDAEYHERFDELMKTLNVKISEPRLVDKWNGVRNKYIVTITRNGQRASFAFYDSVNNTENDGRPELYDILTVLGHEYLDGQENAEFRNFKGFAEDFGYSGDFDKYEEAKRAYNGLIRHYKAFSKVIDEKEVEALPN